MKITEKSKFTLNHIEKGKAVLEEGSKINSENEYREDLSDIAAIWLEEQYISGDTMVYLNHGNIPKDVEGCAMYVHDLLADFLLFMKNNPEHEILKMGEIRTDYFRHMREIIDKF